MTGIQKLKPSVTQRVREVANAVGISIEGWGSNDRHRNSRWCFGTAGAANVGFAWWKSLQEDLDGNVFFLNNAGDWADQRRRLKKAQAAAKADEFNSLILACYYQKQPVRIAIVDGPADPDDEEAHEKASKRQLDDALWYPHHRDPKTGYIVVMRDVPQPADFDPHAEYAASLTNQGANALPARPAAPDPDLAPAASNLDTESENDGNSPERKTSTTTAFPRDSDVVRAVKLRVIDGRCECCGEQGFWTARGGYYLEVHHVIPLSCEGVDAEWNAMAICPGDHKQAHFGANRRELRDQLVQLLGARYPHRLGQLQEMAKKMDFRLELNEEIESQLES